jgi:polyphosphate glucokinase
MVKKTGKRASQHTILAIDVGGSRVKFMTDKERTKRAFASGPDLSARAMVTKIKALTKDWSYDVISIEGGGQTARRTPIEMRSSPTERTC